MLNNLPASDVQKFELLIFYMDFFFLMKNIYLTLSITYFFLKNTLSWHFLIDLH